MSVPRCRRRVAKAVLETVRTNYLGQGDPARRHLDGLALEATLTQGMQKVEC
jgi:hypothetical protein